MPDLWGSVEILVDFYKKSWLVRSFCAVFMRFCLTKGFFLDSNCFLVDQMYDELMKHHHIASEVVGLDVGMVKVCLNEPDQPSINGSC